MIKENYTNEDIAIMVHKVAPVVYDKNQPFIDLAYEKDDFVQDAYLHIAKLNSNNYFSNTDLEEQDKNIEGAIYTLLNGFFVRNIKTQQWRNLKSVDYMASASSNEDSDRQEEYLDVDTLNPSENHIKSISEERGKVVYESILEHLDPTPYRMNKYPSLKARVNEYQELPFSEATLGRLYLSNLTSSDVIEAFGFNDLREYPASKIARNFRAIKETLNDLLVNLDKIDLDGLTSYLEQVRIK